jgi:hypothetical protein
MTQLSGAIGNWLARQGRIVQEDGNLRIVLFGRLFTVCREPSEKEIKEAVEKFLDLARKAESPELRQSRDCISRLYTKCGPAKQAYISSLLGR